MSSQPVAVRRWAGLLVGLALTVPLLPTADASEGEGAPPSRLDHLVVRDGPRIADSEGRTVLLRGINVNQLGDYFRPNPDVPSTLPLSRTDFERIAALGMNTVRLLVHWSRLEPEPGVRDAAHLAEIAQAVAWAEELGLYVVLDMHQDAWGKHIATDRTETCTPLTHATGWDGAPEWATFTEGLPRCKLQLREMSAAVAQAFSSFWADRPASDGVGIQQHLIDTWAWLAGTFRDTPAVVGYDLLNEPHPGWTLGATGLALLGEYYRRTLEAIREAEDGGLTKIVFFEPMATWSATSVGLPRPFTLDTQIVYAPHIYTGSLNADRAALDEEVIPIRQGFEQAQREAAVHGTTFWSGEWGFWGGATDTATYMRRYATLEDEYQVGGAIWQWKQACGDPHSASYPSGDVPERSGNVVVVRCGDSDQPAGVEVGYVDDTVLVLSRPYPRRFPGRASFSSDPDTRTLEMSGESTPGGPPVELWIPGATEPELELAGLTLGEQRAVTGGWLVTAAPTAPKWHLRAVGS